MQNDMGPDDFDHTAHLLGHCLAERALGLFLRKEQTIPREWEGNADDARSLAAEFADPEDREILARAVLRQAIAAWTSLVR